MITNDNKERNDIDGLRRKAEIIARSKKTRPPDDLKSWSSEEFLQVLHDLQVHQIELEMQNEELRRAQRELEIVKERYFDLYNLAPVGYITVGETGLIQEVNITAATLLGAVRGTLIKQPLCRFICDADQDIFYHHRKRLLMTSTPQVFELRMVKSDGLRFWVSLDAAIAPDAEGLPALHIVMSDITARRHADEALLENRQRLSNIIEFLPTATMAIDKEGRVIIWNKAIEVMTGIPASEMIGKGDHAYMVPFYGEARTGLMDLILKKDKEILTRYQHITGNDGASIMEVFASALYGKGAWVFAKAAPLRDLDGNVIGAIESIRDISDQKLAEAYGEMSRDVLRILNQPGNITDSIRSILPKIKTVAKVDAIGVRLQDGDDYPYLAQDGFSADFLLTENSLIDRTVVGGVCRNEDGNIRLECTCGMVIASKTEHVKQFCTPGGSFWTNDSHPLLEIPASEDPRLHPRNNCIHHGYSSVALIPIRNQERIVGLIQFNGKRKNCFTLTMIELLEGIASHIGEALMRKQSEKALIESEARYAATLSVLETGLWDWQIPGRHAILSPAYYKILGYDNGEFLSSLDSWRNLVHPDDVERVDEHLRQCFASGTGFSLDIRMKTKSGDWRWVSKHGKTIQKDADGKALRMVGTLTDITERKLAEEDRKNMQIQLQQAQKMEAIGTLAGGIAHDFNNILGAILGYAEMVREDSSPESVAAGDLDQIILAANRAKDLVKQILAFSRQSETDKIPLQPAMVIKESLKLLRSSLPATIDIRQDIDAEAGLIHADPTRIHQIVMNLCTNAFHAMEETGGILSVSLKTKALSAQDIDGYHSLKPGEFVELSVEDSGSGIPEEIKNKIFDPYFTTKQTGKGTGMGLAIIHGIVQTYGGYITCRSQVGRGTVFTIFLPVFAGQAEDVRKPVDLIPTGTERVLFVDDEEILATMGQAMLERLGYSVTMRTSSIEALAIFRDESHVFDLVITDQTMPEMTGIDLARSILRIRPGMPIILCTGYSSQVSEESAKSHGIAGFAMKPLARKDLAVLIRKILDAERAGSVSSKGITGLSQGDAC